MSFFWQDVQKPVEGRLYHLEGAQRQIVQWLNGSKGVLNVHGPSGSGKKFVVHHALTEASIRHVTVQPSNTGRVNEVLETLLHCRVCVVVHMGEGGTTYDSAVQKLCAYSNTCIIVSTKPVLTRRVKMAISHISVLSPTVQDIAHILNIGISTASELRTKCNGDLNLCTTSVNTGFLSCKDEYFYDVSQKFKNLHKGEWTDDIRICNIISSTYLCQKHTDIHDISVVADTISHCDNMSEIFYGLITLSVKNMRFHNITESSNHSSRKSMNLKSLNAVKSDSISIWYNGQDPSFWSVWNVLIRGASTNDLLQPGWKLAYRMGNLYNKRKNSTGEKKRLEKLSQPKLNDGKT
jgi:hypothetical protein